MAEQQFHRLSDKVYEAFELALSQKALDTAHHLYNALETALTRNTGGANFVEKRGDVRPEILDAIKRYKEMTKK